MPDDSGRPWPVGYYKCFYGTILVDEKYVTWIESKIVTVGYAVEHKIFNWLPPPKGYNDWKRRAILDPEIDSDY
jgi:hypothetical protein